MKHKLLLLATALWSQQYLAQITSGGPDAYGYTWKNSVHTVSPPAFQWVDITTTGTQVTGLADDNVVGPFTASTGFQYYWYGTPEFYIGSNGYISFTGDNIASPFPATVPDPAGSNNWIAPFLSDLNFSGVGNPATCYYYSNADSLVVSFIDVPFWVVTGSKYTGRNTFQVILNKIDKSITFNYLIVDAGTRALPPDMTIGIENITGTLGLQSMIDSIPNDTFSIRYYYPPTVTYMAVDGGVEWNGNEVNGGSFMPANGPAKSLTSSIRNYGNTTLNNINVLDTIYDASGTPVSNGSATITSLSAGNASTVTFSNTFSPTAAGTYRYKSFVSGIAGDLVAANDFIEQEVVVLDTTSRNMMLEYTDHTPDGSGLGWNGGDGGIGIYFEPPVYPAKINKSRFYINANATPVGFYAKIYDDDGPGGDRGTLLDSIYVPPTDITLNVYTLVSHAANNIVIDSGGFYLVWHMEGADIDLARDLTAPISRRTYEILGPGWSGYRRKLTEDFLMGVEFDYAYPLADFTSVNGLDPIFTFYDMSTNDPTKWHWDFGDGDTSDVKNPFHTYLNNGDYDVCLTASNAWGSDSICKKVNVSQVQPQAKFTFNAATSPTIVFTDQSFGPPISWVWDFDDGGTGDTSSMQNPVYTFKSNGSHNVCLIIGSTVGISSPFCQLVQVTGVGIADRTSQQLTLLPNPAGDWAYVILNSEMNAASMTVHTYNTAGIEMKIPYDIMKDKILLHTSVLDPGLYLIRLLDSSGKTGQVTMIIE